MPPDGDKGAAQLHKFILKTNEQSFFNKLAMRSDLSKYGLLKTISLTNEGFLLIFTEVSDSNGLLNISTINGKLITISALNSCKGTIFCYDFIDCSDQEIVEQLPEGVSLLRRLPMRGSTSLEHSARLLIEFQAPSVPSHVILNCNLRLEVRDHVPAPSDAEIVGHSGTTNELAMRKSVAETAAKSVTKTAIANLHLAAPHVA